LARLSRSDWDVVQNLFDAIESKTPAQQEAAIARSGLDDRLAGEVRALLAASAAEGILDRDQATPFASATSYSSLASGTRIGVFEIDRLIGRGGMGEVYEAHRTGSDFSQRVAIKLLRPEAVEQAGLFDRERRMLASLEHPGIARLIDGGQAPDGRAYMAMEYVNGTAIDQYCNTNALPLNERLILFRAVCDAVTYAHTRLVIHRDLKPSNIVVDQDGRVKLLDFGIAKLVEDGSALLPTQVMVTPDYASPEQMANAPANIATDVYALGVILYELLTGKGPWQSEKSSYASIMRRMLHDDPPLPSQNVMPTSPVPAPRIAGDLDAIILKAMRREPDDRYKSVAALSDDITRHLETRPVLAREGSARYMVGRFVRRYRWAVGAGVAALIAILIGAGGIAWQARKTAIERDVAVMERRRADATNLMLASAFRESGENGHGDDITVKQMLDDAAARLVNSVKKDDNAAEMIFAIAILYIHIDDQHSAETLLEKALKAGIGRDDPVITAQIKLKLASIKAYSNKVSESRRLLAEAAPVFDGEPSRFREERVDVTVVRAIQARRSGDPQTAIALLTGVIPQLKTVYVGDEREQVRIPNTLLSIMLQAKQLEDFPALLTKTREVLKRTGQERGIQGLNTMQHEGRYYLLKGDVTRAEAILTETVRLRRSLYGPSAAMASGISYLADAKLAANKPKEAIALFEEAREMALKFLGPTGDATISATLKLARALADTGKKQRALGLLAALEPDVSSSPDYAKALADLKALRAEIGMPR